METCINKAISIDVITKMLSNRRYIGEYSYRDIVVPNGMPTIIPEDLFKAVQEKRAKNKKAPARKKAEEEEYLLTTKLYCGHCGALMLGESGTSHTGKVHRYYKCVTVKTKKACKKKSIQKDLIENAVIIQVRELIFNDEIIEQMIEKVLEL